MTASVAPPVHQWTIFHADLDPTVGREQAGEQPVLVVSAEAMNAVYDVVMVAPLTSRKNNRRRGDLDQRAVRRLLGERDVDDEARRLVLAEGRLDRVAQGEEVVQLRHSAGVERLGEGGVAVAAAVDGRRDRPAAQPLRIGVE